MKPLSGIFQGATAAVVALGFVCMHEAAADTWPAEPINGLQFSYSVSGAKMKLASERQMSRRFDIEGLAGRILKVTISSAPREAICNSRYGDFWKQVALEIGVGEKSASWYTDSPCTKPKNAPRYEVKQGPATKTLEVPIPESGTVTGVRFDVSMIYVNPRYGDRVVSVSGMGQNIPLGSGGMAGAPETPCAKAGGQAGCAAGGSIEATTCPTMTFAPGRRGPLMQWSKRGLLTRKVEEAVIKAKVTMNPGAPAPRAVRFKVIDGAGRFRGDRGGVAEIPVPAGGGEVKASFQPRQLGDSTIQVDLLGAEGEVMSSDTVGVTTTKLGLTVDHKRLKAVHQETGRFSPQVPTHAIFVRVKSRTFPDLPVGHYYFQRNGIICGNSNRFSTPGMRIEV
jgi:hypothetical protein